jgi:hypothetical protein
MVLAPMHLEQPPDDASIIRSCEAPASRSRSAAKAVSQNREPIPGMQAMLVLP